jgi:mono/diheme cytochrome c family protein
MIGSFSLLLVSAMTPTHAVEQQGIHDDIENGRQLADALCAVCHLRGNESEKMGPMGLPGFPAVANRPNQTPERIVEWLRSAPSVMPDHRLTQDEMDALAAFIMSLRTER